MSLFGDSVEKDIVKAIDFVQRAAKMGYTRAESFLAYCYFKGNGVDKDYNECIKWVNNH